MSHEKNIPAEQPAPKKETRISGANALADGTQGPECSEEKGTQESLCLSFRRKARLRTRAEFQQVYRDGARIAGRFVVLFFLVNDRGFARMGVTASKRVGSAVVRSRCRRRARELFRRHQDVLRGCAVDVVVNARRSLSAGPWRQVENDFLGCLHRVRQRQMKGEVGT